ncbi:MAG: OmpA family protein [Kofleriaceae bacterium]
MKTITLAFVLLALIGGAGCGGDKAKTKTIPTEPQPPPATTSLEKPEQTVQNDTPVSPNLAVSSDILAACGIKPTASASPKFDYDKDELTDDDKKILDQIATCLTTGPLKGKAVSLIGRADPRGTEEYNLGLGSRRATSVSQYLSRLGVTQPQLAVTTRGALDATGTDEAGWQADRRVDIQLKQETAAATP